MHLKAKVASKAGLATPRFGNATFCFNCSQACSFYKLLIEALELKLDCEAFWPRGTMQYGGFRITARETKRRFLPAWVKEFTWLKEDDEKMYCDICEMTGKKNPFTTTGCNNYQKCALGRHNNSKDHVTSISGLKLRKSFQVTVANAKKNIE